MIKRTIKCSIHTIHLLIRDFLILLLLVFVSLFLFLKSGIYINHLSFKEYKINGLYIKLNKKLILKSNLLEIPKTKESASFNDIPKTLDSMKYFLTFFETIELKKISYENRDISLYFKNEKLKIKSDEYEVIGSVEHKKDKIIASIPLFKYKEFNLSADGKIYYNLKDDTLKADGNFSFYWIKGEVIATKDKKDVAFNIKTQKFKNLKGILEKFQLPKALKLWLVDRVKAKEHKVLFFKGKGTIGDGKIELKENSLKAKAYFYDVKTIFNPKLEPIVAKEIETNFKNSSLYLSFKKPIYKKRVLKGSLVTIKDILDNNNVALHLDLKIRSPFDKVVHKILTTYKVNIPISQKRGELFVNLKLKEYLTQLKTPTEVTVKAKLANAPLKINKLTLFVTKGDLFYKNSIVTLKNIGLNSKNYKGNINGTIDISKSKIKLKAKMKEITLYSENEPFFKLKNRNFNIFIDYKNNLKLDIPKFKIKIVSNKGKTTIDIKNLLLLKTFVFKKDIIKYGGNLKIVFRNLDYLYFYGNLKRKSCFFYGKNGICHTNIPIKGRITPKNSIFYAFNKKLTFNINKNQIRIKNLNIDLKKFLKHLEKKQKRDSKSKKMVIIGKNSHISYKKYHLLTNSYDIEVLANGKVKAMGSLYGDIVKFNKNGNYFKLEALRIKDKALHPLIQFKGLQKGRYSLKQSGTYNNIKGEILIDKGVIKGVKTYNNILAFLNTIPAIATLNKPGFSDKGFEIDRGIVKYKIKNQKKAIIDAIYLKGKSSTIMAKGEIDILKETISMDVSIHIARELGDFLGSIPLLGYILMGEEKSIVVGLKVSGNLNNPKITLNTSKDLLFLPIKLLNRVLKSSSIK